MTLNPNLIAHFGLIFVIFNLLVLSAAFMVWMERKVCAYIQDRMGPNRVGVEGVLQPFADVIKLLFKEELRPRAADMLLFAIAPVISACAAFAAFSVVPFGTETTLFGLLDEPLPLQVTDVNESGTWWGVIPRWYIFLQPIGFLIYMIAGVAETNRAPFDFPEAEQELVAGYHTEYSSMSFALFFLAEYVNMVTVSAVATSLYLGGWLGPFLPDWLAWIWFLVKVFLLLFFYVWMRWTLPRYRYDQLMEFGWKWLLPAAVLNLLATAALVLWIQP
jgi:NADH-quinone oxidoreductase subunit H